jgi:hypothetical protein
MATSEGEARDLGMVEVDVAPAGGAEGTGGAGGRIGPCRAVLLADGSLRIACEHVRLLVRPIPDGLVPATPAPPAGPAPAEGAPQVGGGTP